MKLRWVWSVSWLVRGGSCVLVMVVCRCMGGCWYGCRYSSVDRWGVCVCWSRSMVSLVRWCGLARLVVVGLVDDVPCGGMVYVSGLFVWVLVCALVWLVFLHGHVLVGLC